MNLFQEWRIAATSGGFIPAHDNGHLLSGYDFTGSTVGYAGVSAMCNTARSDGITMARKTSSIGAIATIMGHEVGHNFGMSHTDSANSAKGVPSACPSPTPHVMDPSTSSNYATVWTVCSQQYLKYYIEQYVTVHPH